MSLIHTHSHSHMSHSHVHVHVMSHSHTYPLLNDPLPPDNVSRFTAPSCLARSTTTSEWLAIPARSRMRESSWQACEGSPATSGIASWWTSWCSWRSKQRQWSPWNNLCTHIHRLTNNSHSGTHVRVYSHRCNIQFKGTLWYDCISSLGC